MLQALSLFPESRFFRVKGDPEINHNCGGCSSLIVIAACLAILTFKLIELFGKTTITYSEKAEVKLIPPMTTISTYQNDTQFDPFMMAVHSQVFNPTAACPLTQTPTAWYDDSSASGGPVEIILEPCTIEHFPNLPEIHNSWQAIGGASWLCLPLNKHFQIGGLGGISGSVSKQISFQFTCSSTCMQISCGHVSVYEVKTLVNPKQDPPFSYYLDSEEIDLYHNTSKLDLLMLDQQIINTDVSLLPSEKISSISSLTAQPIKRRVEKRSDGSIGSAVLALDRSTYTYTFDRKYMKILDVLAYVGGIFPSLLGLFFFLNIFALYFFEMSFAYRHFKCPEAEQYYFWGFVKMSYYKILKGLGFQKWKKYDKQMKANQTMKKQLDIQYFFLRLQMLERGMSMLLEDHQLKGIYLTQTFVDRAQQQRQKTNLRNRMIKYMVNQQDLKKQKEVDMLIESQQINVQSGSNLQSKGRINKQNLSEDVKYKVKSKKIAQINLLTNSSKFNTKQSKREHQLMDSRQNKQERMQYLNSESRIIGQMQDEQIDRDGLLKDLQQLKRLFKQAEEMSDPTSARIVGCIDNWLKTEIQSIIIQNQNGSLVRSESAEFENRDEKINDI